MTDHAERARDLLNTATHCPNPEASNHLLGQANVEAVLAVAHELRAANLIRYWSIVPDSEKAGNAVYEYITTTTQPEDD